MKREEDEFSLRPIKQSRVAPQTSAMDEAGGIKLLVIKEKVTLTPEEECGGISFLFRVLGRNGNWAAHSTSRRVEQNVISA